jgi:hypothetical protein
MRKERTKQTYKLRLLAFVLALALLWYSLDPAPGSIARTTREDEVPDEKKREAEPQFQRAAIWSVVFGALGAGSADRPLPNQDEDDFDWPEFIDA